MPKICYVPKNFKPEKMELIEQVNSVVKRYGSMGYDLTLRQVYYQLVASDIIPNNERSYKNLGVLINDARLAGLIDWYAIIDRTRYVRHNPHWTAPDRIVAGAAQQYARDHWEGQPNYVEVWVEKDALVGIVGQICSELDVPFFSCRGYTSQSEMWSAARRFMNQDDKEQRIILHLGDHDPSGIDMSRDIQERLDLFEADVRVERIALTMNQIEELQPPPNPAKLTDSRCGGYISRYGYSSWELDALDPQYISKLITNEVTKYVDMDIYDRVLLREREERNTIQKIADNFYVTSRLIDSYNNNTFVINDGGDDE